MELLHILLLAGAGLAGGFLAGLVGVGGGVIFSPVLFFYFSAVGTPPALIPPLTLGSSLFCTLVAAGSGTIRQLAVGGIETRIAGTVGVFAAVSVTLMTFLVTTRPWYGPEVFQIVLAVVLIAAVARMLFARPEMHDDEDARPGIPSLAAAGVGAGTIASAAGVGGGIVMVPIFNQLMRIPLKKAAANSMATIVIIAGTGVVTYVIAGLAVATPATALGFVDFGRAVWLAVPALFAARWGVQTATRVNVRVIRYAFAGLAGFISLRLIADATGIL